MPVVDAKERTMSGADDLAAVHGEKPCVLPVKRCADMRAIVEISKDRAAFSDDEQLYRFAVNGHLEPFALALGDIVEAAEPFIHGFVLPMAQMRFHSSSAMGKTDSRDCRTRARFSNRGSALTSVSVTGTLNGRNAFTSTMPNRPD